MTVVEAFNYRVGIDASGMESGGRLTRRELSMVRSEFRQLTEPAEKVRHRLDLLTKAFNTGSINASDYAAAQQRLRATLPENVEATKRAATAESDAASIRQRLKSESQLYADELQRVKTAVREGGLSHREAAEHLRRYRTNMSDAKEAAQEKADAERESAQIVRGLMTDEQRYVEERRRVNALVDRGGISQQQATQHLRAYRGTLQSVISAETRRNQLAREGEQLTERYETSLQRYRRELERINTLQRSGAVSANTANLARRDARAGRLNQAASVAGAIPGGGAVSQIASNAAMLGPALAAGVVGIGSLVVAWRAGSAAASAFARSLVQQADRMNNLALSARLLGTDTERLSAFQYAAETRAGIGAEQSIAMLEKLSAKLAEAAAGSGEAKPILEQMGLDAGTLARMDPSDALARIADGMAAMQNPAERSRAAMKLFEEEGRRMSLVLSEGSAGLEQAAIRAQQLGFAVSSVDAASVNIATDAVTDLQLAAQGFSADIAGTLSPVVAQFTGYLEPLTVALDMTAYGFKAAVPHGLMLAGALTDLAAVAYHAYQQFDAIKSLDFSRAADEFNKMTLAAAANSGVGLVQDYLAAQAEAAALAKADQQRAAEGREAAIEAAKLAAESAVAPQQQTSDAQRAVDAAERELDIRLRMKSIRDDFAAAGEDVADSVVRAKAEAEAAGMTADQVSRIVEAKQRIAEMDELAKQNAQAAFDLEAAKQQKQAEQEELKQSMSVEVSSSAAFSRDLYQDLVDSQRAEEQSRLAAADRENAEQKQRAAQAEIEKEQQRLAVNQGITQERQKQLDLLRQATSANSPSSVTPNTPPSQIGGVFGSSNAGLDQVLAKLDELIESNTRTADAVEGFESI